MKLQLLGIQGKAWQIKAQDFKVAFEPPPHPSLILAGHRGATVPHKTVAVLHPYARGWLEWRSQELGH